MPTVLIVKENKDVCFVISEILRFNTGYDVISAANVRDCLRTAKDEAADVILLDTYVPGMEGFKAYAELKNNEETMFTPVIFLVQHHDEIKDMAEDTDIGTYDYLVEPFNTLELTTKVKAMLRLKVLIDYQRQQMAGIDEKLRTYLQPIMGYTELLKKEEYGPLTAKQKEFINLIHESGKKILQITEFRDQIE
jgi:DNA-binding response OmpR family regulator